MGEAPASTIGKHSCNRHAPFDLDRNAFATSVMATALADRAPSEISEAPGLAREALCDGANPAGTQPGVPTQMTWRA